MTSMSALGTDHWPGLHTKKRRTMRRGGAGISRNDGDEQTERRRARGRSV